MIRLPLAFFACFDRRAFRRSCHNGARAGRLLHSRSPDLKYLYLNTGGQEPTAFRVRLTDQKVEKITGLKGLPLATGPGGNIQFVVAPDGSSVFTRDTGTQEIYALTVKWP